MMTEFIDMMISRKLLLGGLLLCFASSLVGCSKEEYEPFDHPFVHIHVSNNDQVRVRDNRNEVVQYGVYLSAKLQFEATVVDYEIVPGNGLTEGVDYEVVRTDRSLIFDAGVFEDFIAIRWLANEIDPTKTNTLTIRLLSNNRNFTIGLPGPDHKQSALTITKF